MNEIEKINEELRNHKLFKIQRVGTRKQEFDEFKNHILKTKKGELLNYFLVLINFISILYLIYNLAKSFQESNFYDTNKVFIILNFLVVIAISIYISVKLVFYIKSIKTQLKKVENAIQYFSTENEVLKAEYENLVNNYLQKK